MLVESCGVNRLVEMEWVADEAIWDNENMADEVPTTSMT